MKKNNTFITKQGEQENGFSLIELLVVISIVGLLASQVIMEFTSPRNNVKASIMNMRADFNLARSEAINRNQDVRIDFLSDADIDGDNDVDDGYIICVDNAGGPGCDPADIILKKSAFVTGVKFYDVDLRSVGGPDCTTDGSSLTVTDGITFSGNNFSMQSDGTTAGNKAGTVYVYIPGGTTGMKVAPYAVVVSTKARIRVRLWRKDLLAWSTK